MDHNIQSHNVVLDSSHTGDVVVTVDGFDVIECVACGFKHTSPLLSDEELKKFYTEKYYTIEKSDYIKDAEENKEWWFLTYDRYFDMLEKYVSGRRLLDIGSGPGYFLECGKKRGWDVVGFEPSSQAAQYAQNRGLNVINEMFTAGKVSQDGLFDAVSINFVLEHLRNPIGLLKEIEQVLTPGGLVLVVSPNDFNALQNILWHNYDYKPWWVLPLHHINYFDFSSIKKLLSRAGYSVLEKEATFPMEFFLLSGDNYVDDGELGRVCHLRRKKFETSLYLYDKETLGNIYRSQAQIGIGREFVILAKKQ